MRMQIGLSNAFSSEGGASFYSPHSIPSSVLQAVNNMLSAWLHVHIHAWVIVCMPTWPPNAYKKKIQAKIEYSWSCEWSPWE